MLHGASIASLRRVHISSRQDAYWATGLAGGCERDVISSEVEPVFPWASIPGATREKRALGVDRALTEPASDDQPLRINRKTAHHFKCGSCILLTDLHPLFQLRRVPLHSGKRVERSTSTPRSAIILARASKGLVDAGVVSNTFQPLQVRSLALRSHMQILHGSPPSSSRLRAPFTVDDDGLPDTGIPFPLSA